jgi:hypothetical protein
MPIEIRELVIKVNVEERPSDSLNVHNNEALQKLKESIIKECLDRLKKKNNINTDR